MPVVKYYKENDDNLGIIRVKIYKYVKDLIY